MSFSQVSLMLITSNGYCSIVKRSSSNAEAMLCVLKCITFMRFGLMMRDWSGPGSSVAEMLSDIVRMRMCTTTLIMGCTESCSSCL